MLFKKYKVCGSCITMWRFLEIYKICLFGIHARNKSLKKLHCVWLGGGADNIQMCITGAECGDTGYIFLD